MAKQLVNPVERHVEKAVLGIAGLLLIGVIVRYLVTSPNQLNLGGDSVTASSIAQRVAQKADSVREQIRRADSPVEMPESVFDAFVEELDPFKVAGLSLTAPVAVAIGPEVPLIDPPEQTVGNVTLAEVKVEVPSAPAASVGRSTYSFIDPSTGRERYFVANWVTVTGLFDVRSQMAEQAQKFGATRMEVFFGPAELQRRARRDDGSWHEGDWQSVKPWPAATAQVSSPPRISLERDQDLFLVPQEDIGLLNRFFEQLIHPLLQLDILRPRMPEIVKGDKWAVPLTTTYRDVLMQDDFYLNPAGPPSTDPTDRYKRDEGAAAGPGGAKQPTQDQTAEAFKEIERLIKSADNNLSVNDAIRAYNQAFSLEKEKSLSPSDRARATRLKEQADQLIPVIRRKVLYGERETGKTPPGGPVDPGSTPERNPLPLQQLWAHDAEPGSVQSGRTYQYRIRARVYNRLAGEPERFKSATDAQVIWIDGEWSEPVEVEVEPSVHLFVISEDQQKRIVTVELYQWFEGVWVKAREKFGEGQPLTTEARCDVPSLHDPGVPEKALVRFEADATTVDIDFARPYRERKRGVGRSGVKLGPLEKACSVVFIDSAGRLSERFVPTDKSDPAKKSISDRVWSPR